MKIVDDPEIAAMLGEVPSDHDLCHLDFETYSDLDVRKVGAHRVARHHSTEVLIACYQLPGDYRVHVWLPRTQPVPRNLAEYAASGGDFGAHNANFERLVWRHCLRRRLPTLPDVADDRWVCTAAKAAASGLPRSLDKALAALGSKVRKNADGTQFIKTFCKPRKPTKKDPRTRILPEDDPVGFKKGIIYCQDDVRGEVVLDNGLRDLTPREQLFFRLDMRMNDRGLPIDVPLVKKALHVVDALEGDIKKRFGQLSGGLKATQVQKVLAQLEERGIEMENMRAETLRGILKQQGEKLDPEVREMLELRLEGSRASTKKLVSMLTCADPHDFVVQGGFLYHGAHTGRYAGRLVQPHNFIRGLLKFPQRQMVFDLLEYGDPDLFRWLYKKPIDAIAQCMRGFICAPEGYEFAVVDYTAIEARILAWLAGEHHMLKAYFAGTDVYKLMASKLFKIDIEDVSAEQRRLAKNLVLGCGYSLGGDRFVEYCANLGVVVDPTFAKMAVKFYRQEHPAIVESWKIVEGLVVSAITNPGKKFEGLKCRFYMRDHWLCIQLPSGRELRYPYARAVPTQRWGKPAHSISFRTEYKGQFFRENTYGGKLIENIVQAIARDVMMEGMYAAEKGGWPLIGTVHDELLTLVKKGHTRIKELQETVCVRSLHWVKGMPLAAEGFACIRYAKDAAGPAHLGASGGFKLRNNGTFGKVTTQGSRSTHA